MTKLEYKKICTGSLWLATSWSHAISMTLYVPYHGTRIFYDEKNNAFWFYGVVTYGNCREETRTRIPAGLNKYITDCLKDKSYAPGLITDREKLDQHIDKMLEEGVQDDWPTIGISRWETLKQWARNLIRRKDHA